MNELTKKRATAFLIDTAIAQTATIGVERWLDKKAKNKFFYAVIAPSLVLWGLEYAQIRLMGQTIGQKVAKITIKNLEGGNPASRQILKRAVHRDTKSQFDYLRNRQKYRAYRGARFPHDFYAGTIVKEQETGKQS